MCLDAIKKSSPQPVWATRNWDWIIRKQRRKVLGKEAQAGAVLARWGKRISYTKPKP